MMSSSGRSVRRPVHGIVLAAGTASRLCLPKFLLPAGPDETFLTRAVGVALTACDGPVHVVTGRDAELASMDLARWLADRAGRERVAVAHNNAFARGLSTSLRIGLARAAESGAAGALVVLADQPAVDPTRARTLVERFVTSPAEVVAVAPSCGGQQRNPVVMGRALFSELEAVTGDQGARGVLRAHAAQVTLLEWGEGLWAADVDTWADYVELARALCWDGEALPAAPAGDVLGAFRRAALARLIAPDV